MLWREVVRDIEHDVADDATDGRQGDWGDVLQSVLVSRRVLGLSSVRASLQRYALSPVDLLKVSNRTWREVVDARSLQVAP